MNNIKISEQIAPYFHDFYKEFMNQNSRYTYFLNYGGRMSTKSSLSEAMIAMTMLKNPNIDVIVIRENYGDHKDSTFNGLLSCFERLGVKLKPKKHYPIGSNLFIRLPNGSNVRFYGNVKNGFGQFKGIRPTPGNKIKIIWLFEIDQFMLEHSLSQTISSFIRGGEKDLKILAEWNPPSPDNYVHDWLNRMFQREDVFKQFSTYLDIGRPLLTKWAGEKAYEEIETIKIVDPEAYESIYLGKPILLEGKIYKSFDREKHTIEMDLDKIDYRQYELIVAGMDIGYSDRTVCSVIGIKKQYNGIDVLSSIVFDDKKKVIRTTGQPNRSIGNYTPQDVYKYTTEYLTEWKKRIGCNISVIIDSANKGDRLGLSNYIKINGIFGIGVGKVNKKQLASRKDKHDGDYIEERIRTTIAMLGADMLKINKECKDLIMAFETAIRDNKGKRRDDNTTVYNDDLDAFEYAWLKFIKILHKKAMFLASRNIKENDS